MRADILLRRPYAFVRARGTALVDKSLFLSGPLSTSRHKEFLSSAQIILSLPGLPGPSRTAPSLPVARASRSSLATLCLPCILPTECAGVFLAGECNFLRVIFAMHRHSRGISSDLQSSQVQEIVGRNCRFLLNGVPSNLIDAGNLVLKGSGLRTLQVCIQTVLGWPGKWIFE